MESPPKGAHPFLHFGSPGDLGEGVQSVYSHETRVALVKERVKQKKLQRQLHARSGALMLAALVAGAVLAAAAFCLCRGRKKEG